MEEIGLAVVLGDSEASIVDRPWRQLPFLMDRSGLWMIHWSSTLNEDSMVLSRRFVGVLVMMKGRSLRKSHRGAGD